jgi:spoIIIJ-associated protein
MADQNVEKSLDVNAKTVDEAIEQGLAQLGLPRDQVDIEIIKEGKRGVFGLGSEDAQVRLIPKGQTAASSSQAVQSTVVEAAADGADQTFSPGPQPDEPASPPTESEASADQQQILETGEKYLSGLLERMGIEAAVTIRVATDLVEADEEPPLVLDITGKDLGILIGRRSETLRALQYMVRLMVSKEMRSWQPIVVDVESYRVRRRRSLRQMAQKMAERAAATGKRVVLEAMPAYERRIIHLTLKDHPAVHTKSIGSDDNRKVTIIPK